MLSEPRISLDGKQFGGAAHLIRKCRSKRPACLSCPPTPHQTCVSNVQDSIGQTLLQACAVIDDGLLVFLPSYSLLDRLVKRWQVGGSALKRFAEGCTRFAPRKASTWMASSYDGLQY